MACFRRNDFNLPEAMGVGHYAGLFGGGVDDYAQWRFTTNGATTVQDSYITTALTDLAIEWIAEQEQLWFAGWLTPLLILHFICLHKPCIIRRFTRR